MSKQATENEYRFVPKYMGKIAAQSWRIWIKKNDVYTSTRASGDSNHKISVHESGKIHIKHDQGKDTQNLVGAVKYYSGIWLAAFELRFILSSDAYPLPKVFYKNNNVCEIEVPSNHYFILTLLIGTGIHSDTLGVPIELQGAGAKTVWKSRLENGKPVWLVGWFPTHDDFYKKTIQTICHDLNPKLNSYATIIPETMQYMEVMKIDLDHNIIAIVPRGKEAFNNTKAKKYGKLLDNPRLISYTVKNPIFPVPNTKDYDLQNGKNHFYSFPNSPTSVTTSAKKTLIQSKQIFYSSPNSEISILAPNDEAVSKITFSNHIDSINLEFDKEVIKCVTKVCLVIDPNKLIRGNAFFTRTYFCSCVPIIDGIQPNAWNYPISAMFDGTNFIITIGKMSTSLRNQGNSIARSINASEEIILAAPYNDITIHASLENPIANGEILGSFVLRKK